MGCWVWSLPTYVSKQLLRQSREAIQQIVYHSILVLRGGCNAKRYPHCHWKHSDEVNDVPGDRLAESRSFRSLIFLRCFVVYIVSPTSPTSALSHSECELQTRSNKHRKISQNIVQMRHGFFKNSLLSPLLVEKKWAISSRIIRPSTPSWIPPSTYRGTTGCALACHTVKMMAAVMK